MRGRFQHISSRPVVIRLNNLKRRGEWMRVQVLERSIAEKRGGSTGEGEGAEGSTS